MCGICGIYNLNKKHVESELVRNMCNEIIHRGPDEEGYYINDHIVMGIRRLKVIDLTTGSQPIFNEDKTIVTVFNGEIYNFVQLKESLENKGHKFYTNCDTEVILHLYEDFGEEFVKKLRGMFAIALFDIKKNILLLYRDRIGIKPLFYCLNNGELIFSSEIKSILKVANISREIDKTALNIYLTFGYITAPFTIYKDIKKLSSASFLKIENGSIKENCYWNFDYMPYKEKNLSKYVSEGLELLEESLKLHLISDVPLGVFLSGGLDSSTLVALMRKLGVGSIKTFSIGFEEKSYNESDYAIKVAKLFETEHFEFIFKTEDLKITPDLIYYFDEPFGDSSSLPLYILSKNAKQQITVALSGEGGDEMFAGYYTYQADKLAFYYRHFPDLIKKTLKAAVNLLPVSTEKVSFDYKLKKFVQSLGTNSIENHFSWKTIFNSEEKNLLLKFPLHFPFSKFGQSSMSSTFSKEEHPPAYFPFSKGGHWGIIYDFEAMLKSANAGDLISKMLFLDSKFYLPDDLLVKADKMSMAASLELRVPFVDHKLVEFLCRVPSNFKLKYFNKKFLLKEMMKKYLPDEIINRKKGGFNIPLPIWIKSKIFKEFIDEYLSQSEVNKTEIFNYGFIETILKSHFKNIKDYSRQIWTLLVFMIWFKNKR